MLGAKIGGASGGSGRFHELTARWGAYFPNIECSEFEQRVQIAYALTDFFLARTSWIDTSELRQLGRITLDFTKLETEVPVADFATALRDEPHTVLGCLALGAHLALDRLRIATPFSKIIARISNSTNITPVRSVKANLLEKFISIRGTVTRVGSVRPLVKSMTFECGLCGHREDCTFPDGQYSPPVACAGNDGRCRNQMLNPDRSTALAVDWQLLRVQEQLTPDHVDMGRIPRAIDCELTEDLVDGAPPGEAVIISGIVKARKPEGGRGSRFGSGNRQKSLFVLYIDVNSVSSLNGSNSDSGRSDVTITSDLSFGDWPNFGFAGSGFESIVKTQAAFQREGSQKDASMSVPSSASPGVSTSTANFAEQDLRAVADIAIQPDLVKLLVHSFCPSIFGQEMVKFAILLTLMGGTQRMSSSIIKNPVRSDIHLLIVGDPGLGKSQLLRSAAKLAPRGVYIAGNAATNAGLTVTLHRDGREGDYSLEPGALVIADRGVCCIDELDKMSGEQNALLEAMEQQTVSVAKAGIVCQLMARTSVLAAANPTGGHYDKLKTVAENLKMGMPLLSRFDLTFILLDRPNIVRDLHLSEHVVSMHGGSASKVHSKNISDGNFGLLSQHRQNQGSEVGIGFPLTGQSQATTGAQGPGASIFHAAYSQATATPGRPRPSHNHNLGAFAGSQFYDRSGTNGVAKKLPFSDEFSSHMRNDPQIDGKRHMSRAEAQRGGDSTTDIFSDVDEEGIPSFASSSGNKRVKYSNDLESDSDASLFADTRASVSRVSGQSNNIPKARSGELKRLSKNLLNVNNFRGIAEAKRIEGMLDECQNREQQAAEMAAQQSLSDRLTMSPYERQSLDTLPQVLLRKYIIYAREHVHPKLTQGAKQVIESFFMRLRRESRLGGEGFTPVTTRQLEALVRLTEARAKLELRDVATASDAVDVVDLMKESLFDVFSDDVGCVDLRRTTGLSKAKQANFFIGALRRVANAESRNIFTVQELKSIARKNNLDVDNFDTFVESLNNQNLLLSKGNRRYQLQAT